MPPEKTPPRAAAPEPARPAGQLAPATRPADLARFHAINRLTWGASASAMAQAAGKDFNTLLAEQLAPGPAPLPAAAQAQIDALTLSQQRFTSLMFDLEQRRRAADALKNDDEKRAAQQAYPQELTRLADVGLDPMAAIATLHARDAEGVWHVGVPAFREIWLRLPRYAPGARRFAWVIDSRALAWAYAVFCRLRLPRRCRDGRCPA
jgi:hypothetical protein